MEIGDIEIDYSLSSLDSSQRAHYERMGSSILGH